MKKFFKILIIIIGSLIGLLALIIGGFILWSFNDPDYDISPSAYHWKKGMTEAEIDSTAHALLAQMSLEEKVDQMDGDGGIPALAKIGIRFGLFGQFCIQYAGRNERLDIPPLAFSDGPRGITVGPSTAFPVAIARGATWDTGLERRVGEAIGKEARAQHVNYFGGVCINLLRHPAWGRSQETFGEDPFHLGEMVVALTNGLQSHNVIAVAKHFALNSVECSRMYIDVTADERTLHEVYLPHFKRFVDAGGGSIMSAYNKVNGQYCGNNHYLLYEVLREQWGFKGLVSSDWVMGTRDGIASAKAGLDVEMPIAQHYGDSLVNAVKSGRLEELYVDSAVLRILRTKLRFITRNDPMTYEKSMVASEEHRKLAMEVAEKSFVLLKNENHTLPLSKNEIKKLAVIGHLADEANLGDHGSSYFKPDYVVTLLQGLKNYLGEEAEVTFADGKDMDMARKYAAESDAVLLVAGYNYNDEGEYIAMGRSSEKGVKAGAGGDRLSLTLHPEDETLIKTVAAEGKKCIVGLIGGGGIITENWKNDVPAIVMAWYPGMEGGTAFARMLFGEVNPSGKLPFSVPATTDHLPYFDAFTDTITYDLYHGYTLMDKKGFIPAYPFGYGLSYTTWQYDSLWTETNTLTGTDTLDVFVKLTNTGKVAGEEVVQLYAGFGNSAIDRPDKLLRGFDRISLSPGESGVVRFKVTTHDLCWYNPQSRLWEYEKMEHEILAGPSSDDHLLLKTKISAK